MELGAFSISLAVKNIEKSKQFYESIGFQPYAGDQSQHWLIMKNGDHIIGLFQGMFEANILTFNPGWDKDAKQLKSFTDIRQVHASFKAADIPIIQESINGESGPANFSISDPDGNIILIDQHV